LGKNADFLPFMVRKSLDSFALLSVKDVMLFQHCQQELCVEIGVKLDSL
jgi:hypothetical protein